MNFVILFTICKASSDKATPFPKCGFLLQIPGRFSSDRSGVGRSGVGMIHDGVKDYTVMIGLSYLFPPLSVFSLRNRIFK